MLISNKSNQAMFFGISIAVIYGLFVRLTFGAQSLEDVLGGLVTITFIFFVPMILGIITMAFMPRRYKLSWPHCIFLPWISFFLVAGIVLAFAFEALICVMMAAPIYLPLASAGGIIVGAMTRRRARQVTHMSLAILLLIPYFTAALETQLPSPTIIRTVESQIVINAPAKVVWPHITSVPEIQPFEHHLAAFYLVGVPKPVQAMLPEDGIGAVRISNYQDGLRFEEVITEWQPQQGYKFTIGLDPHTTPPRPWNNIGGSHFGLLDGVYKIEPLDDNRIILHLSSRHRLQTKLNLYGGIWTDFILRDIQNYILTVIKGRAEAEMGF